MTTIQLPKRSFAHRRNRDGSWDSICLNCFFTVATQSVEQGLTEQEQMHDCETFIKAKQEEIEWFRRNRII